MRFPTNAPEKVKRRIGPNHLLAQKNKSAKLDVTAVPLSRSPTQANEPVLCYDIRTKPKSYGQRDQESPLGDSGQIAFEHGRR